MADMFHSGMVGSIDTCGLGLVRGCSSRWSEDVLLLAGLVVVGVGVPVGIPVSSSPTLMGIPAGATIAASTSSTISTTSVVGVVAWSHLVVLGLGLGKFGLGALLGACLEILGSELAQSIFKSRL